MPAPDLKIAVLGAGRMGQQVVRAIDQAPGCQAEGVWSRSANSELATLLGAADVAIDFTLPGATTSVVRIAT